MNLLIIAPYHVSGTLDLWQRELRRRGHECRYVTLFRNRWGFSEDISLDLPLMPRAGSALIPFRRLLHRIARGPLADDTPITERPPLWKSPGLLASSFFTLRDMIIAPRVLNAIQKNRLDGFDIIWLDQGGGFFRDARVIRRWAGMGKHLMAFYHGSDMRNRGIYPQVDRHLELRLTSEVDLLELDPRLRYLFLPVDTSALTPDHRTPVGDGVIRIAHAARVRAFKGTDRIIEVVERLRIRHRVELVLIENVSHIEALAMKRRCDIAVDQIADTGGWGYGMSSVEYLSLGIPTCTSMNPEMQAFLPGHPFVAVSADTLETELERLITDEEHRQTTGKRGREWVVQNHDIRQVADRLWKYFEELEWV
ncbi:MAG: glycosyltransferase [bacterium]